MQEITCSNTADLHQVDNLREIRIVDVDAEHHALACDTGKRVHACIENTCFQLHVVYDPEGKLYSWGACTRGSLGHGNDADLHVPTRITESFEEGSTLPDNFEKVRP